MKRILIIIAAFGIFAATKAATPDTTKIVFEDDTLQTIMGPSITILQFKNAAEESEYWKTYYRIKAVLPYVKIAKQLYAEIQEREEQSKRKREFKRYRKDLEKDMRAQFEKELKDLTIGQGIVMVKLINRETGNNCYEIIKDVKGGGAAFFWNLIGKRYGYNLKQKYNHQNEHLIEMAIEALGREYNV